MRLTIASVMAVAAGLWLGVSAIGHLLAGGRFERLFGPLAGPVFDGLLLLAAPICLVAAALTRSRPGVARGLLIVAILLTLAFHGIAIRSLPPVGTLLVAVLLTYRPADRSVRW